MVYCGQCGTWFSEATTSCSRNGITRQNDLRVKIISIFGGFLVVMFVTFLIPGCTVDKSSLENDVKKVMVETTREEGHNLTISKISLVHQGGNNYEGLAEGTLDGDKIQLDVYVVCDGVDFKAEWQPTAAYIQEDYQKQYDEMMEEYHKQLKEDEKEYDEILKEYYKNFEGIKER